MEQEKKMTPGMPFNDMELVDALRISDAEWVECIREMDHRAKNASYDVQRRTEERQSYRNNTRIIVCIRNYDGRKQQFIVRAYDLTSTGLGFLHGSYIYQDTPAEIYLEHKSDGMIRIPATIRCCTHVKKRIHLIGAQFDEPITLSDYLLSAAA